MAKKLNIKQGSKNLEKMLSDSVKRLEEEARLKKENSGFMVQYCPCGHSRELNPSETELVEKAKKRILTHVDALTLSSDECPTCRSQYIEQYVGKNFPKEDRHIRPYKQFRRME